MTLRVAYDASRSEAPLLSPPAELRNLLNRNWATTVLEYDLRPPALSGFQTLLREKSIPSTFTGENKFTLINPGQGYTREIIMAPVGSYDPKEDFHAYGRGAALITDTKQYPRDRFASAQDFVSEHLRLSVHQRLGHGYFNTDAVWNLCRHLNPLPAPRCRFD